MAVDTVDLGWTVRSIFEQTDRHATRNRLGDVVDRLTDTASRSEATFDGCRSPWVFPPMAGKEG